MEYRLGKLPAKHDPKGRTLKLASILRELPPIPAEWGFDQDNEIAKKFSIPDRVWLNDTYGDCVEAEQANQTTRFELIEQGKLIDISDQEVKDDYFRKTGGSDDGLVILDSLKDWKNHGWIAAGKRYCIDAFARINPLDHNEVMAAIYCLTGIPAGVQLPQSAMDQLDQGKPWTVIGWWHFNGRRILGGHCVYPIRFNSFGPILRTWGQEQQASWNWWDTYADEAFGIVNNKNIPNSPLDVPKLESYLTEVSK